MKKNVVVASVMFVFILVLGSCNTAKTIGQGYLLTDNAWELFTLEGDRAIATDYMKGLPNLTFTKEGKLSGTSGCNSLNGSYELGENSKLTFGPMATTRMACPGEGEGKFLNALNSVTNVKTEKNKLTLLNGTKVVMVLTPKL